MERQSASEAARPGGEDALRGLRRTRGEVNPRVWLGEGSGCGRTRLLPGSLPGPSVVQPHGPAVETARGDLRGAEGKVPLVHAGASGPRRGQASDVCPTPQTETMFFLLLAQAFDMLLSVADCKNACCQSERLKKPRGRVFVEPCDGVPVEKGRLVELLAPVYSLNDAPLLWHKTHFPFAKLGVCQVHPGSLSGARTDIRELVLVEVDDLAIGELTGRINFVKWKERESEYASRRLRQGPSRISMDQEKYILEHSVEAEPSWRRRD